MRSLCLCMYASRVPESHLFEDLLGTDRHICTQQVCSVSVSYLHVSIIRTLINTRVSSAGNENKMCMSCYASAHSARRVGQLARGRTSVVWQHYIARVDDQRHIRDCRAVPSAAVPAHRWVTMTQQGQHRTMSCPQPARRCTYQHLLMLLI